LVHIIIEEIVTAADVSNAKPAPHVYLELARRLGVHPSDCVAIEDAQNWGIAALAAGTTLIARPEHDESIFHGIRSNLEAWRFHLPFKERIFIIPPDANPLATIQRLHNNALANARSTPAIRSWPDWQNRC
jgi:FMN phosphatase YigB (HAD superfamily)